MRSRGISPNSALPAGIRRVGELAALLIEEEAINLPPLDRDTLHALLVQLQSLAGLEATIAASHRKNADKAARHFAAC
jgi:hypothetical protein